MDNTLSPELKAQIEKEAEELTSRMIGNGDYYIGKINGYEGGYSIGAEVYALKLQQAEEMMGKMAAILKQMAKGNPFPLYTTEKLLKEYNNYKQTKDGTANG